MVRRPSPLALQHSNVFPFSPHQTLISSNLAIPTSPMSPRTPLTPPPRLHLRTVFPSPPLSPSHLVFAPSLPYHWIWRCHLCHSVYRLGVTRRCLEDGHFLCSFPTPPSSPVSEIDSSSDSGDLSTEKALRPQEHRHHIKINKEGRRRKRKPIRVCRAEFDYTGWSSYNSWRREIRLFKSTPSPISDFETEGANPHPQPRKTIESNERNCWMDCDFPSECHNLRLERLKAARAAAKLELMHQTSRDKLNLAQEWEKIQSELEIEKREDEIFGDEELGIIDGINGEEDTVLQSERRGVRGEAELEMVDLPLDSNVVSLSTTGTIPELSSPDLVGDLLGEEGKERGFVEKKRRKSILKIHQLTGLMLGTDVDIQVGEIPPSSPLKKSFGQDEVVGVALDEGKKGVPDEEC